MGKPTKKKLLPSATPASGTYLIHKPYADPIRCERASDVKRVLNADMAKLRDHLKFFGNDLDRLAFGELAGAVGKLIEAGEGEVALPYDTYSGVLYRVRVEQVA